MPLVRLVTTKVDICIHSSVESCIRQYSSSEFLAAVVLLLAVLAIVIVSNIILAAPIYYIHIVATLDFSISSNSTTHPPPVTMSINHHWCIYLPYP